MTDHPLDLVVYGATGFTGRQAARYVAERAPPGLRWGVGGRDRGRLEEVRRGLGSAGTDVEVLVADARDPAAVEALVRRARVVASTAGPFARYGTPVVEACVAHGVHYADITGETPWVRRLIDRHHDAAATRGTRIVPCCGFDSVPSDLGAWLVVEAIRERWGEPTRAVRGAFSAGGGGLNGGTLASLLAMADEGELDRLADPVLLTPPARGSEPDRTAAPPDRRGVDWDPDLERWLAPFVMAPINTRVVRRSAALREVWGEVAPGFSYDEGLETRRRTLAWGVAAGTALMEPLVRRRLPRRLARRLGPEPGEGPSEAAMDRGWFRCRLVGVAASGRHLLGEVAGQGDPGNRATVTFLCEAALALTGDLAALPGGAERGGVLTPSTALGGVLADRLRAVGVRLDTRPLDSRSHGAV